MLRKTIEIIIGIVFIVSALTKLLDLMNTVNFIISITGFSFYIAKFSLIVLAIVEVAMGISFIFNYWKQSVFFYPTFFLVAFFMALNVFLFIKGYSNCGCFGTKIESSPLLSFIKNLLIILYIFSIRYSQRKFQLAN